MEYFWNNIASLAVIPIVLGLVLKLKGVQIDSLKQENKTLESHVSYLERSMPSGMEKEYEALKKFSNRTIEKLQNANEKIDKLKIKIERKEQLDEKDIDFVSSVVGLTQECLSHYASGRMFWSEYLEDLEKKGEDLGDHYPPQKYESEDS